MDGSWLSFCVSLAAVGLMLVLHAYLVMCEISLVKFRYENTKETQTERLKSSPGLRKLMENSDQTGRVVRSARPFVQLLLASS